MNARLALLIGLAAVGPTMAEEPAAGASTLRPTWTPYSPPPPTFVPGGLREGEFFEATLGLSFAEPSGVRRPLPDFSPTARSRLPGLNAGDANGDVLTLTDTDTYGDTASGFFSRLTGGYRFEGGWGEVLASARGVEWEGHRLFANGDPRAQEFFQQFFPRGNEWVGRDNRFDNESTVNEVNAGSPDPYGAAVHTTKAHAYAFDLAYGNGYMGELPVSVHWTAGGRFGGAFVEDRTDGRGVFSSSATRFSGAGPAASVSTEWHVLGSPDGDSYTAGLYFRGEGAALFGRARQTDREGLTAPYPVSFRYADRVKDRVVPVYGFEVGLSIRGPLRRAGLVWGYQFERWVDVGRVGGSRFDLSLHGAFLRADLNF